MNEKLRDDLRAAVNVAWHRVALSAHEAGALNDAARILAAHSEVVDAWAKVLVKNGWKDESPADVPLDFPDKTPAEIIAERVGTAGVTNYRGLSGAQINALVEAAGMIGTWSRPTHATWDSLRKRGYVSNVGHRITGAGREWLRAAGLLKDGA